MEALSTDTLLDRAFELGMVQIRAEIAGLVELLRGFPLRNVMEIGSESGGTFYLWCRLAALGGLKISLDWPAGTSGSGLYSNPRALAARAAQFYSFAPRIRVITGDSHNSWVRAKVTNALAGEQLDFLFIDGDHSYEGVKQDWNDYRGLVRPGGLVAFHDINDSQWHRDRGCFVADFWKEFYAGPGLMVKREFNAHLHWGGIGVVEVGS